MSYDPDDIKSCYEPSNYNKKISGLDGLVAHHWVRFDAYNKCFRFEELRNSLIHGDKIDKIRSIYECYWEASCSEHEMRIFNDKTYTGFNNEWTGTQVGDSILPRQQWV